jgi:signal transduction histidine kinase
MDAETAAYLSYIGQIDVLQDLLRVVCDVTGMGFAAVGRVTDVDWTACAVHDQIGLGMRPGQRLEIAHTLCRDLRTSGASLVIDHVSHDARYRDHPIPRLYGFESYIAVPVLLAHGVVFGTLCAADKHAVIVSEPRIRFMFACVARLIGQQVELRASSHRTRFAALNLHVVENLRRLFVALQSDDAAESRYAFDVNGQHLDRTSWRPILRRLESLPAVADAAANDEAHAALVDEVLGYVRARPRGQMAVRVTDVVDLAAVLHAVVKVGSQRHPARKVIANISLRNSFSCDGAKIKSLASELLNNALSHGSPRGSVAFIASFDGSDLVIQVWNDEHLPADALADVFNPFRHVNRGGGLHRRRLPVCAEIVSAHRGDLRVTSSSGNGTHFTARIPNLPPVVRH